MPRRVRRVLLLVRPVHGHFMLQPRPHQPHPSACSLQPVKDRVVQVVQPVSFREAAGLLDRRHPQRRAGVVHAQQLLLEPIAFVP